MRKLIIDLSSLEGAFRGSRVSKQNMHDEIHCTSGVDFSCSMDPELFSRVAGHLEN